MNTEQLKEQVTAGLHIRDDVKINLPRADAVRLNVYIDLVKYGAIFSA